MSPAPAFIGLYDCNAVKNVFIRMLIAEKKHKTNTDNLSQLSHNDKEVVNY